MSRTIVCFGAGPAYKGGMSNYNISLAKTFAKREDVKVHIVSWSQQYPAIVPREFKDLVSKSDFLEDTDISVKYITNYNNPLSYSATAKYIANLKADIVIIQWSIAIQGLPIGRMIKKLKKISNCEIIVDLHFVIQKEESSIDQRLTKYGIKNADSYIVHALKTYRELQEIFPQKKFKLSPLGIRATDRKEGQTVIKLYHPIYDLYKADPKFDVAKFKSEHNLKEHVFLFFGFIRKYKGLHNAIDAFAKVAAQRDDVSFLICGELFWDTLSDKSLLVKLKKGIFSLASRILLRKKKAEGQYNPLTKIKELDLEDRVMLVNNYIPNEDVHKYFQLADSVVLFYETATPSGIESLSYNFDLPILATKVGHFPETIREGENGYMAEAEDIDSMASVMIKSLEQPIPRENVSKFKVNLSWEKYVEAILNC